MEVKVKKFLNSVGDIFTGGDFIPLVDSDVIAVSKFFVCLFVCFPRKLGFLSTCTPRLISEKFKNKMCKV